ncbi:MAG: hypothetical protein H7Z75_19105 [Ferruginibacter sp.]|nr:hypothetical protein [Cytophagales bacterium]
MFVEKQLPIYTAGLLLLFNAASLQAQDSTATYYRPIVFKTNLSGPFSLLVEGQVAPRKSLQFSVQRINVDLFGFNKFFSFTPEFKFYLSKRTSTERRPRPSGFYVSPYLKYRHVYQISRGSTSGSRLSEVSYHLLGGGTIVGRQVIFRGGFALDAFLGGGYFPIAGGRQTYGRDDGNGPYREEIRPQDFQADIRVGICIGYAFKAGPPG